MMDIAPQLLKEIQEAFNLQYVYDEDLMKLLSDIENGKAADFRDAQKYADIIGDMLGKAYENTLSKAELPNDRLFENICDKVIKPTLENNVNLTNEVSGKIQQNINDIENIGLRVQYPEIDSEDLERIIHEAANSRPFDKSALNRLVQNEKTFTTHSVDRFVEKNASFQFKSGMSAKIIRKTDGKCCEWCQNLAGVYNYPDVPKDVYKRHNNCGCTIEYYPGKGKRLQDVHNKGNWRTVEDGTKIELRQQIGADNSNVKDVTKEYVRKATPGKGKVVYQNGYTLKDHEDEIEFSDWIHKNLGGNLTLVKEIENTKGALNYDYIWNNKNWDLKTISTANSNSIDKHIRKGLKQIVENPGGIFINMKHNTLSIDEMMNIAVEKAQRRLSFDTDIIVVNGNDFKAVRINKK